jgi:hypothetical protein
MSRPVVGFISVLALLATSANAQTSVVTRCMNPLGHAYYSAGGLVAPKDAGWQRDAITNGQYLLVREKDGKFDIVFTDATRRTMSTKEDGGQVLVAHDADDKIVLLIIYPQMSIETWVFTLNSSGIGKVSVSQARYGDRSVIRKHSLMAADCRK